MQTRHGIELNGIVLVSSLLTYQTIIAAPQNDAAVRCLHRDLHRHRVVSQEAAVGSAGTGPEEGGRRVARVCVRGVRVRPSSRATRFPHPNARAVAQKLARFTGLSPDFVERANLRVNPGRFRKELLRDKRLTVGRLDSRFTSSRRRCGRRAARNSIRRTPRCRAPTRRCSRTTCVTS